MMSTMYSQPYHTVSIHGAYDPGPMELLTSANNNKTGDSSSAPSEAAEPTYERYLELRWSHTAKFLRDFTQRKNAQAEEIRRYRASLQLLSAEERSAALADATDADATSPGPHNSSPFSTLSRRPLDESAAGQTQPPWQQPAAGELQLPAMGSPRQQRQSQAHDHGSTLLLQSAASSGGGALASAPSADGGASGGGSASTLDALLQSVLQRSTAVSTKLTKAYAVGQEQEHAPQEKEKDARLSRTSLRKMATSHSRVERGRSLSRVHRNTLTHHPLEDDAREPSPTRSQQHQQQQQARAQAQAGNAVVSPVASRPDSPIGLPGRDSSSRSSLPQLPAALMSSNPTQPGMPAAAGEPRPRDPGLQQQQQQGDGASEQQLQLQQRLQQRLMRHMPGGAATEDQPLSPRQLLQQQQLQQQSSSVYGAVPRVKRASSSGYKPGPPFGRRELSQSLDGGTGRPRRRSEGTYTTPGKGGDGGAGGMMPRSASGMDGSRGPSRRRTGSGSGSGSSAASGIGGGVRLPQLPRHQVQSKAGGARGSGSGEGGVTLARGAEGRTVAFGTTITTTSCKSPDAPACGSNSSSGGSGSGEASPGRGGGSAARRQAAARRGMQQQQSSDVRRAGSASCWPMNGQSSWAKSTSTRQLVFTQF